MGKAYLWCKVGVVLDILSVVSESICNVISLACHGLADRWLTIFLKGARKRTQTLGNGHYLVNVSLPFRLSFPAQVYAIFCIICNWCWESDLHRYFHSVWFRWHNLPQQQQQQQQHNYLTTRYIWDFLNVHVWNLGDPLPSSGIHSVLRSKWVKHYVIIYHVIFHLFLWIVSAQYFELVVICM